LHSLHRENLLERFDRRLVRNSMFSSNSQDDVLERDEATSPSGRPIEILEKLRSGVPITDPVCVLVAHPDDETICMGGRLANLRNLTLVHMTDGSPGTGTAAETRSKELREALRSLSVRPKHLELGVRDQTACFHLPAITRALLKEIARAEIVITHPYEGGHPDHDASAFAVQSACQLLERRGEKVPVRLEFACYHLRNGRRITGAFLPRPGMIGLKAELDPDCLERKKRALSCFRSQAETVAWFAPEIELYRAAPLYDFRMQLAAALYDLWDWPVNSAIWQAQVARALIELGLARGE
jgi:LmbE family N-acetylglucosaminyl deacetylase